MIRLPSLLLLAPLSTLACFSGDGDDDIDEVVSDDLDEDGLTNDEEADLGTDPESADSDGDGWTDGEEVELVTDPLDPFSWDFGSDRWPDFTDEAEADGVVGEAWARSTVVTNFETTDQFGNPVELYDFYGYVILIDFSAGWCGPCRAEAQVAEGIWEDYREDGFMILHAMIDDNQGTGNPDLDFLQSWADQYDLEFPVLDGGTSTEIYDVYYELYENGINTGAIPFMVILDQDLELRFSLVGSGQEDSIRTKVERLLDL